MEVQGQNPAILYRRFRKEIRKLPSEYNFMGYKFYVLKPDIHDFLLNYDYDHNYLMKDQLENLIFPLSFYLKNANKHINLIITNMGRYPFQPPQLLLNNKPLINYYRSNIFIKYEKYLIKPKKCCLICSSILSSSNWSCVSSFGDVFFEMCKNFVLIKRAIEMFHMDKIMLKNVGDEYLMKYALNYL
jgi:hypothetical protein